MKDQRRSIFRDEAIRNYSEGRKAVVLPRLVSPSKLNLLWALLGLFVAAGIGGAYFVRIPVYASGSHGASEREIGGARRNVEVVVSLPKHTPDLHVGQKLTMKADLDGKVTEASIVAVKPEVADPEATTGRPAPSGEVSSATGSSTTARPEVPPGSSRASLDEGGLLVTEAGTSGLSQSVSLLLPAGQDFGGGG